MKVKLPSLTVGLKKASLFISAISCLLFITSPLLADDLRGNSHQARLQPLQEGLKSSAPSIATALDQTPINSSTVPDEAMRNCLIRTGFSTLESVNRMVCTADILDWSAAATMQNLATISITGSRTDAAAVKGLSVLNTLPKLTYLALIKQGLVDQHLSGLNIPGLKTLFLNDNLLQHTPQLLTAMTGLELLCLPRNNLQNIADVAQLSQLKMVCLEGNPITDFQPLAQLPILETLLLETGQAVELSNLKLAATLKNLSLWQAPFAQVSEVAQLLSAPEQLHYLRLINTGISSLNGLEQFSAVRDLELVNNWNLTDYSQVNQLPNLTDLTIMETEFDNLAMIQPILPKLRRLKIADTALADLTLLANASNLQILALQSNRLTSLKPILPLTKLTELYFYGNYSLLCHEVEYLRDNKTVFYPPLLCSVHPAGPLKMFNNSSTVLQSVSFASGIDAELGNLSLQNNQVLFTPNLSTEGSTGWIRFEIVVVTSNERYQELVDLFVAEAKPDLTINPITVPDPVLRACALNSGASTLDSIRALECDGVVKDWRPVQQMYNLITAQALGNEIQPQTIQGLAAFNDLLFFRQLVLDRQGLTEQDLASFTINPYQNFFDLALTGNFLTGHHLSRLLSSPNLMYLDLTQNKITQLPTITNSSVITLSLAGNPIADLRPLSAYSGLKHVSFNLNQGVNTVGLTLPASLIQLQIDELAMPNLETLLPLLSNASEFYDLSLHNSSLTSLKGLEKLPNLGLLELINNADLTDYGAINQLEKIFILTIKQASFTNLASIATVLPTLGQLDLSHTLISDFTLLNRLNQASSLDLNFSKIRDLTPLHQFTGYILSLVGNSQLLCQDLEILATKIPDVSIVMPELCSISAGGPLKITRGGSLLSASFKFPNDNALGSFQLSNGQLQFSPASGIEGWISFELIYTTSTGETRTELIELWIEPKQPSRAKRRGLPWWVIAVPKAA